MWGAAATGKYAFALRLKPVGVRNENHDHQTMDDIRKTGSAGLDGLQRTFRPEHSPAGVTSAELLGAARELLILHAGRQYRLLLTQNGKLILTA
jgi:hemin uptake protein HemP